MLIVKKTSGFTIVELLVVIVVIGVLAAITVVSYNGISNRATVASLKTELENASKQLKLYQVVNSAYPGSLAAATINFSSGTTTTYYSNTSNPQVFCVTAVKNGQSYYLNQDGSPLIGSCAATNLATNPGFESATVFLDSGGGAGTTTGLTHSNQDTSHVLSGTYAGMAETNGATGQYYFNTSNAFVPIVGHTYFFSAYVYIPIGSTITGTIIGIRDFGTYSYLSTWQYSTLTPGQWTRISCSYTATSANPQWRLTISDEPGVTPGNPQYFWVDGVMITDSKNLINYADGSSRDWSWTGAANASTSTGPAY